MEKESQGSWQSTPYIHYRAYQSGCFQLLARESPIPTVLINTRNLLALFGNSVGFRYGIFWAPAPFSCNFPGLCIIWKLICPGTISITTFPSYFLFPNRKTKV